MQPNWPLGVVEAQLAQSNAQVQALLRELQAQRSAHGDLVKRIQQLEAAAQQRRIPRFIEDVEGPRKPYKYVAQMTYAAAATGAQTGAFTVSQDGPFVYTRIGAVWVPSAGAAAGRQFPITSLPFLVNTGGAAVPADAVDFLLEFQQTGADRMQQNVAVPAGTLIDGQSGPYHIAISGWMERNETMRVTATPAVGHPINADNGGVLHVTFIGYKILIPISLAEAFAWTP